MTAHNSTKELETYFVDYGIDIKEEPLDTDIKLEETAEYELKTKNSQQLVKQVSDIYCNVKVEDASTEEQENSLDFVNVKQELLGSDTECETEFNSKDSTHNQIEPNCIKQEYETLQDEEDEDISSSSMKKRDKTIACKHAHDLQSGMCTSRRKREDLRCCICSRKFAAPRSLDKHLEIIHSETTSAEEKFTQATSDNLPKVDNWMLAEFISETGYFIAEKIKRVKELSFDLDSRIGYVELRSENNICTVRCKICSAQNENQQIYAVTLDVDQVNNKIISVTCMECEESLGGLRGGCEHVIMFLMWLNKKTEKPAPSAIEYYWREPNNYLTLKELFGTEDLPRPKNGNSFLETVVHSFLQNDKYSDVPLVQYFREKTSVEMLDLYLIGFNFVKDSVIDFIKYSSGYMAPELCQEATELTRVRYKSELWFKLRFARVSCSKVYDVAHCRTDDEILKEKVMGTHKYKEPEDIDNECTLKNKVIKIVETKCNIKCRRTGLMLNKTHPILIATPDSISEEYVVEIKHLTDEKPLSQYISQGNQISDKYIAQLQLQMYFSGKKKGIFCVANFENNETVIIIVVDFDEFFIKHLIKNVEEYWNYNILPILLSCVKNDK